MRKVYTEINWLEVLNDSEKGNEFYEQPIFEQYEFLKQFIPICYPEIYDEHIRKLQDFLNI